MSVTLLIAYRSRRNHLEELLRHLASDPPSVPIEIIVIEGSDVSSLDGFDWPPHIDARREFVSMDGAFHKTRLLNRGLEMARGDYVIPYDVDLIPLQDSISVAYRIARKANNILVSGYRLMCHKEIFEGDIDQLFVASEDNRTALKKQLVSGEQFGVCPLFLRERLVEVGGWDENFVGWGAEDQDIIERYCGSEVCLARFAKICYVHLHHPPAEGWNEDQYVANNREIYYSKKGGLG